MKKILFALLATASLVSCKKDDDNNNSTPTMSYKIDGTAKSFTTPVAARQSSGGTEVITVSAGTGDGVNIQVEKSGSVTTGSYTGSTGATIVVIQGSEYYMDGTAPINVTITGIDASHVEGTFSGTLEAMTSSATKVVSEGKFYAKF